MFYVKKEEKASLQSERFSDNPNSHIYCFSIALLAKIKIAISYDCPKIIILKIKNSTKLDNWPKKYRTCNKTTL